MAGAKQPGLRGADRRVPLEAIVADFCLESRCHGARVLDLGPGHFEFAEIAQQAGARDVIGVDNDPAVVRLGELRGLKTYEMDIRELSADALGGKVDGIFCRLSLNAVWFGSAWEAHDDWARRLSSLLTPGGWAWLAPWNYKKDGADFNQTAEAIRLQIATLQRRGFLTFRLLPDPARYYGLTGHQEPARETVIVRNLEVPLPVKRGVIGRIDRTGCAAEFAWSPGGAASLAGQG